MKKYTVTLKHDNGKVRLSINAESITDAIKAVLIIEGAPESAIVNVKVN
jgi:formiminotetrahydrofolate cyclodeaminase